VIEIVDGEENEEFLAIWKASDRANLVPFSDIINEWNGWYREVRGFFT
jgi:hypothetical protein